MSFSWNLFCWLTHWTCTIVGAVFLSWVLGCLLEDYADRWWCKLGVHQLQYLASYERRCKHCRYSRPGWGEKHLSPGDNFEKLKLYTGVVNPDDFRKG